MTSAEKALNKRNILGYPVSDIVGILLMVIPFTISIVWNDDFKFFGITIREHNIQPDMIMALFACAFYLALIVRYGFFKKESMKDIIISVIRAFLDIWVLSSFLMTCFPKHSTITNELLLLAVAFTWLGIRSIAGYGWIFTIILGVKNIVSINARMGMIGAIYIIIIVLSLILQVSNVVDIKNFVQEINGKSKNVREIIKDDMNVAAEDAKEKTKAATKKIRKIV